MEISDRLLCLFSARVEERDGSYVIEVPKEEVQLGAATPGETYRVAMLPGVGDPEPKSTSGSETGDANDAGSDRSHGPPKPPVTEGETREVEIEDIGEQGDGIARVERGYVVIVPGTEKGERATIEITDVQQNVAFAEVVEKEDYFR